MDPSRKNMTVMELVDRYLATKTGVKHSTKANYKFVKNLLEKEDFSGKKIGNVKTSDAKPFLIQLQQSGRRYSTVKTVRGVLRPAFQMAVDDDCLHKNPFGFDLAGGGRERQSYQGSNLPGPDEEVPEIYTGRQLLL